jgi:pimeloyl-ACP methyl ester carboxylesterase
MKLRCGMRSRLSPAAMMAAVTVVLGAGWPASGRAHGPEHAPAPVRPVRACSSLTGMDFTGVPDAPGKVTSAAVVTVTLGTRKVKFCHAEGVFAPQTRFGLQLPVATWHGQYVQEGCSTLCGAVTLSSYPEAGFTCTAVDDGQLALGTDDMGHTGRPTDGRWAKNHVALRVVFGLTSENSLAHMARAVISAYYGRPASYTYYDGCSTGGREALMLAQRYPGDFNGIIAGAPAMNMAPLSAFTGAWMVRSNTGSTGHQIITAENIPTLHAAVIRACGNTKGVIADPRHCAFNPASIQCPAGRHADSCLTPAQVTAVRAFYRGPTDSRGRSLYNGGMPYGSELGWVGEFVEPTSDSGAPGDSAEAILARNYWKYLGFLPNPPAGFTLADVRFSGQEFREANILGDAIYNANNPDLSAFEAHGGKLIIYHGWADQAIPPWSTLGYYAAVEHTMGGFAASQAFSRLYLIPGAYHCLFAPDGEVNLADFLTPLISWVQGGIAPGPVQADTWDPATGKITLHQTVHPYDALAPVTPAKGSLNAHYHYIGSY